MSEILNITDNATEAITKFNNSFSELSGVQILTMEDSATTAIQKINDNFTFMNSNCVFPENTVLSQDIGTLESGEDIGGMTITDFIRYGINGEARELTFLHISDTHNFAGAVTECKSLLDNNDDIEFTILTGDYSAQNGVYDTISTALTSLGDDLLMVTGNHDAWDAFNKNQQNATTFLKSKVVNQDVVWGDSNNVASYWYRDIEINQEQTLRIIGVDSYDYRDGTGSGSIYDTIYSQALIDWFIARITELGPQDYLIIAMHEPPVNATVSNYQYNVSGKMDNSIVLKRRSNKFCSSRLWVWDTSLTNGNLFPIIMDAYINRRVLNTTVNNTNTTTGSVLSTITLNNDFTNSSPCTFLFYIAGHLHGDFVEYHPLFTDQLILLVDNSNTSSLGKSSDLGTRSNDTADAVRSTGIIINKINLDFAMHAINIERIGEKAAGAFNNFLAVTRDEITIPFKKD